MCVCVPWVAVGVLGGVRAPRPVGGPHLPHPASCPVAPSCPPPHPRCAISRALSSACFDCSDPELVARLPTVLVTKLKDDNPSVRRGAALGLGALPSQLLHAAPLGKVVSALVSATTLERVVSQRDAETRRNAVQVNGWGSGTLCPSLHLPLAPVPPPPSSVPFVPISAPAGLLCPLLRTWVLHTPLPTL
jgi:hypothetical protein